jgi:hypothetical protein
MAEENNCTMSCSETLLVCKHQRIHRLRVFDCCYKSV